MLAKKKLVIAGILLAVVVAGGGFWWISTNFGLRSRPRHKWKNQAVADTSIRTADENVIASELASFRPYYRDDSSSWIGDDLLLMKNGEWIAYANIAHRMTIPDLFIGRGSDGKWYYSTYHFCSGLLVLSMEGSQPESLSEFVDTYYLKEFDGASDECLNSTWPVDD